MPGKKRSASTLEEEEFPRGGGSSLAPIVHKQLKKDAYAEAEADLFSSEAKRKGKKHRKSTDKFDDDSDGDEEDVFFGKLSAHGKLPKFVELLKFRNLTKGMKIWGTVAEVLSKELIINLPHGLKGHVSYNQASDLLAQKAPSSSSPPLADLFKPGQYVRCVVVNLLDGSNNNDQNTNTNSKGKNEQAKRKARKKIELSLHVAKTNAGITATALKPGMAFPAYVKSVEDHGYILSFGIKGASGFLPKKSAPTPLHAGSVLDVAIQNVKPGGVIETTALPSTVAAATTKEWEGINISTLLPGSLVNARVRNILSDGLLLSFLTFFTATIDPFHLGNAPHQQPKKKGANTTTNNTNDQWKDAFSTNQKIKARILYVNPETKQIGLSLQRHLLDYAEPTQLPEMGKVFETALIRRVDPGLGVVVDLPEHASGFAHISNLADAKIDAIEERFRPGQLVKCRVIGSRPMDGLANVTLKPSVIEQSMLSMDDVTVGMQVNGTIVRVDDTSLVVQITPHLTALVPLLHLSDVISPKTIRKFKSGQKVSGRVLSVDAETKKVTMTLKPSLIQSKLPIISSLDEGVAVGKSHGVITGVQEYGLFVSFYNNVSGFVPRNECGLVEGQKMLESFTDGQVIKPRVTGVNTKRKGLRLSLISKKKAAELRAAAEDSFGGLEPGSIVAGVVTAVFNNTDGRVLYMDLELYDSSDKSVAVGRLDVNHLSDHPGSIDALSDAIRVGTRFDSLLVLQKLEHAKRLRVTRKASLLASAPTLPSDLTDLKAGISYQGYVASIASDAVFVRFLGDLTGRAGLAQLSDTFVSDPHAHFTLGQSVQAHVIDIDHTKNQFSVSLKHSITSSSSNTTNTTTTTNNNNGQYIQTYFNDIAIAHQLELNNDDSSSAVDLNWKEAFPLGHTIEATTHEMKEYGLLCDVPQHEDLVGIVDLTHVPKEESKNVLETPGKKVTAVVLDYNEKDGVVDLSLLSELVERAGSSSSSNAEKKGGASKGGKKENARVTRSSRRTKHNDDDDDRMDIDDDSNNNNNTSDAVSVGQVVENCTVLLAKPEEGYCIVSLPQSNRPWIGYLATSDYNLPPRYAAAKQPQYGDTITATVAAVMNSGRVIVTMPLVAAVGTPGSKKKDSSAGKQNAKSPSHKAPKIGSVVNVKIDAVHALHADVSIEGSSHRGRIHITEAVDSDTTTTKNKNKKATTDTTNVFATFTPGSTIEAVVLSKMQSLQGKQHGLFEFSSRPSTIQAAKNSASINTLRRLTWNSIKVNDALVGYVQEVSGEYIWVVFSPSVRGRVFLPSLVSSLEECSTVHKKYKIGSVLETIVRSIDAQKHILDVDIVDTKSSKGKKEQTTIARSIDEAKKEGKPMLGIITNVSGKGVLVKLASGSIGRVALTDIHDVAVKNALQGLKINQFVQVALISHDDNDKNSFEKKKKGAAGSKKSDSANDDSARVELSLKPSRGGACTAHSTATPLKSSPPKITPLLPAETINISQLKQGQRISGYVKSTAKTGVFVSLSRTIDARIKLRQLSHTFIENPQKDFPEGTYVEGTVSHIDGGKIDMTLREHKAIISLDSLEEGQVVKGRVKKIEAFGVFVELIDGDAGGACGLAHVSELSDEFIKDIGKEFKVDQRVTARVLSVDKKAGRLSLGLKKSYFEDVDSEDEDGDGEEDDDFEDQLEAAMDESDDDGSENDDDSDDGGDEDMDDDESDGEEEEFDIDDDLMEEEESE